MDYYKIAMGSDRHGLEQDVNEKMKCGYMPSGSITVKENGWMYQPMINAKKMKIDSWKKLNN
jgi:hypothetical protein